MKLKSPKKRDILKQLLEADGRIDSSDEELGDPTPSVKVRRVRPKKVKREEEKK